MATNYDNVENDDKSTARSTAVFGFKSGTNAGLLEDNAGVVATVVSHRRSIKWNELIHRMLRQFNLSRLFPTRLSREDIVEVIGKPDYTVFLCVHKKSLQVNDRCTHKLNLAGD